MEKENNDNRQDKAIIVLENNYQHMSEQIKEVKKAVDLGFARMEAKMETFICNADQKYASKQTEKLVNGLVILILVAFIGGVITLVLK